MPKISADDLAKPRLKEKTLSTRVPPEVAEQAKARAEAEHRTLGEIIRSWVMLFAADEAPSPPPIGNSRAAQRPSKRRQDKDDE